MMRKTLILLLAFGLLTMGSCIPDDNRVNFHFVNLQITDVELPEFFELHKTYEIKVSYLRPNNCIFFEGFDISKTGSTERNVVAVGSELEDSSCAQVAAEAEAYFQFTCYYSDTYIFKFWTGEDENGEAQYIQYEVPVGP